MLTTPPREQCLNKLRERGVCPIFQVPGLPEVLQVAKGTRTRARAAFPAPRARAKRTHPEAGSRCRRRTRRQPWARTSPSTRSVGARSRRGGRASCPKCCTGATTRRQIACSSSGAEMGKKRASSSSPWRLFVALMNLRSAGFRPSYLFLRDPSFSTKTGAKMPDNCRRAASPAGPVGGTFPIWYHCNS